MFWKDKVYVFDDVVSSSQQEEIEAHFTKAVPWYFVEDITSVSDAEVHNKDQALAIHSLETAN